MYVLWVRMVYESYGLSGFKSYSPGIEDARATWLGSTFSSNSFVQPQGLTKYVPVNRMKKCLENRHL